VIVLTLLYAKVKCDTITDVSVNSYGGTLAESVRFVAARTYVNCLIDRVPVALLHVNGAIVQIEHLHQVAGKVSRLTHRRGATGSYAATCNKVAQQRDNHEDNVRIH
jgi:hypothetical protein